MIRADLSHPVVLSSSGGRRAPVAATCALSSAPAIPSHAPGPTPPGTVTVPPNRTVSNASNPTKASTSSSIGDVEPQAKPARRRGVEPRAGGPPGTGHSDGDQGQQRHREQHREQGRVAAGDPDAEVQIPRQEQRDDEQGGGGQVADDVPAPRRAGRAPAPSAGPDDASGLLRLPAPVMGPVGASSLLWLTVPPGYQGRLLVAQVRLRGGGIPCRADRVAYLET